MADSHPSHKTARTSDVKEVLKADSVSTTQLLLVRVKLTVTAKTG